MLPNPATQGGGKDTKLKRQQTFLKLVTFRLHFLPFNGRNLALKISLLMGQTPSEMTRCLSSFEQQLFVAEDVCLSR